MVQSWFMAENWSGDQREAHHMQPPKYIDLDTLYKLTLVEYFKVYMTFFNILNIFNLIINIILNL